MTCAATIAQHLSGRRAGKGWMARCPAHRDCSPSLSISEVRGKVLVHCFGGCTQAEVIDALRARGLWPDRRSPFVSQIARARYARRRAIAEDLARRATRWQFATIERLRAAKETAYRHYSARGDDASERNWAEAAARLTLFESLRGVALASEYRAALKRNASDVRRMIAAAKDDETHVCLSTAIVVTTLALSSGEAS
jgi:hypothetical protein